MTMPAIALVESFLDDVKFVFGLGDNVMNQAMSDRIDAKISRRGSWSWSWKKCVVRRACGWSGTKWAHARPEERFMAYVLRNVEEGSAAIVGVIPAAIHWSRRASTAAFWSSALQASLMQVRAAVWNAWLTQTHRPLLQTDVQHADYFIAQMNDVHTRSSHM
jgi:hypothetical protein